MVYTTAFVSEERGKHHGSIDDSITYASVVKGKTPNKSKKLNIDKKSNHGKKPSKKLSILINDVPTEIDPLSTTTSSLADGFTLVRRDTRRNRDARPNRGTRAKKSRETVRAPPSKSRAIIGKRDGNRIPKSTIVHMGSFGFKDKNRLEHREVNTSRPKVRKITTTLLQGRHRIGKKHTNRSATLAHHDVHHLDVVNPTHEPDQTNMHEIRTSFSRATRNRGDVQKSNSNGTKVHHTAFICQAAYDRHKPLIMKHRSVDHVLTRKPGSKSGNPIATLAKKTRQRKVAMIPIGTKGANLSGTRIKGSTRHAHNRMKRMSLVQVTNPVNPVVRGVKQRVKKSDHYGNKRVFVPSAGRLRFLPKQMDKHGLQLGAIPTKDTLQKRKKKRTRLDRTKKQRVKFPLYDRFRDLTTETLSEFARTVDEIVKEIQQERKERRINPISSPTTPTDDDIALRFRIKHEIASLYREPTKTEKLISLALTYLVPSGYDSVVRRRSGAHGQNQCCNIRENEENDFNRRAQSELASETDIPSSRRKSTGFYGRNYDGEMGLRSARKADSDDFSESWTDADRDPDTISDSDSAISGESDDYSLISFTENNYRMPSYVYAARRADGDDIVLSNPPVADTTNTPGDTNVSVSETSDTQEHTETPANTESQPPHVTIDESGQSNEDHILHDFAPTDHGVASVSPPSNASLKPPPPISFTTDSRPIPETVDSVSGDGSSVVSAAPHEKTASTIMDDTPQDPDSKPAALPTPPMPSNASTPADVSAITRLKGFEADIEKVFIDSIQTGIENVVSSAYRDITGEEPSDEMLNALLNESIKQVAEKYDMPELLESRTTDADSSPVSTERDRSSVNFHLESVDEEPTRRSRDEDSDDASESSSDDSSRSSSSSSSSSDADTHSTTPSQRDRDITFQTRQTPHRPFQIPITPIRPTSRASTSRTRTRTTDAGPTSSSSNAVNVTATTTPSGDGGSDGSDSSSSDSERRPASNRGRSSRHHRRSRRRSRSRSRGSSRSRSHSRSSRRRSSKKHKKERRHHKIFYELSKSAEHFKLPRLTNHEDPSRRRGAFTNFLEKLQNVLQMTKETNRILASPTKWRLPKSDNGNRALFSLLVAHADRSLHTALMQLYADTGIHDGFAALQLLRNLCAAADEDEQHSALQKFRSCLLEEGESIQTFNTRFNSALNLVKASGYELLSPRDVLSQYFRALIQHPSSHIVIELTTFKQQHERGEEVSLFELQSHIQRHEEKFLPTMAKLTNKRYDSWHTYNRRRGNRDSPRDSKKESPKRDLRKNHKTANHAKTEEATANAVSTKPKRGPVKCWNCGKPHALTDCPDATDADKKKIYERKKAEWAQKKSDSRPKSSKVNFATRLSYANMARSSKDKMRDMSRQARRKSDPPKPDMLNGFPVLYFNTNVVLDSGASDHMTGNRNLLTDIETYYTTVMMPDGFTVAVTEKGTMRLAVPKKDDQDDCHILPLLDTLLVSGLHSHLISIPAMNTSGIAAKFDTHCAYLTFNQQEIVIDDPYHRRAMEQGVPFALNGQTVDDRVPARSTRARERHDVRVSMELMHRRMGHRSFKSIAAADALKIWKGVKIQQTPDEYCAECHIGGIPKAHRGANPPYEASAPGKILFLDVIPNPAKGSVVWATAYKDYLIVADAYSRYFCFIGLMSTATAGIIEGLEDFVTYHKPYGDYSLHDINELHADAGSYFTSDELMRWAAEHSIALKIAAPAHQEMNGLAERLWQTTRVMAFRMLTNARLGLIFFHYALMYAWQICVVLPTKSANRLDANGELVPSTPYYLYYGTEPNVSRYRVFGCPVVMKVYKKKDDRNRVLDHSNIVQRGIRGIFVGFPINQAGWEIFLPTTRKTLCSADVSFDEEFASVTSLPDQIYGDSLGVKPLPKSVSSTESLAKTGPPLYVRDDTAADAPWTPFSAIDPTEEADRPTEDEVEVTDVFESVSVSDDDWLTTRLSRAESIDKESNAMIRHYMQILFDKAKAQEPQPMDEDSDEGDAMDEDSPSASDDEEMISRSKKGSRSPQVTPRRSSRLRSGRTAYARHVARTITGSRSLDYATASVANAIKETLGEPGTDPTPFLPEPRGIRTLLKSPIHIKKAWGKAITKETKGLIFDMNVFEKIEAMVDEAIVPLMLVLKCKIDKLGLIDKLKARMVFRGDIFEPQEGMDPWNPHASWPSLKMFLGTCARLDLTVDQVDYIMAYVQTVMKERVIVMLPIELQEFVPDNIKSWFGVPLLLKKALYGYTFSGKLLYEEQAEFLESEGFRKTEVIALWKRERPAGKIILILQYSDDFLIAHNDPVIADEFKTKLGMRFKVETRPNADWYLQARIQRDAEGNYLLDQQRYSKSIVRRYLPNAPEVPTERDLHKYRSPLPHGFKWTKEDNSKHKGEVVSLEDEYGFRYIEAVGSLNYLANTAIEELYAIRKCCKHMNLPGRQHFKALLHLLHHLRCYPTNALIFYKDWKKSPVYTMLTENQKHTITDGTLLWFADASHGDCDEGRSTAAYIGFYQGGIVDACSFVAQPIPHSTAESETIAIALGAMGCSYVRKGIADVLFDQPERPWTVPFFSDSQAAIAMNQMEKPTKRNKHIDKRYFYGLQEKLAGRIDLLYVDTDHSLPDVGTKGLTAEEAKYKLSIMEYPVSDGAVGSKDNKASSKLQPKKGDGMTQSARAP